MRLHLKSNVDDAGDGIVQRLDPQGHVFPVVGRLGSGFIMSHEVAMQRSSICTTKPLDDRPVPIAHGVSERVDEFLVGPVMLVIAEMVERSGRECGDKSLFAAEVKGETIMASRTPGNSGSFGKIGIPHGAIHPAGPIWSYRQA